MRYLNENGLTRYDELIKQWVTFKSGTVDGIDALLNWQKTESAASVSFYPLPIAPLDPVVTFAFTETGPAEGEKSPTNPSTITGVSTITVTRCETVSVDSTDYIIDLNGIFYGGSVDVSAGTMTVTWWGHIFTGKETFNKYVSGGNSLFVISTPYYAISSSNCTCTHFPFGNSSGSFSVKTSNGTGIVFINNNFSTITEFTTWLGTQHSNGTPVTVSYKITTPYIVTLTPTQIYSLSQLDSYTPRINTVYSNQTSIQVGYPKSPLATSIELTNAIISLGGNI